MSEDEQTKPAIQDLQEALKSLEESLEELGVPDKVKRLLMEPYEDKIDKLNRQSASNVDSRTDSTPSGGSNE